MSVTDPANPRPSHAARTTAHKAWVGAVLTALIAGLTALLTALDDGVTGEEWLGVLGAMLAGSGVVGTAVYNVRNRPVS